MEFNYCRRCGKKLERIADSVLKCSSGHNTFLAPTPAAGIFFIKSDGRLLLSKRGIEPFKGDYDTIGGFVDRNETFEQAIEREILEESGLTPDDYGPLQYLCSSQNIYPYQNEDRQVLSVFFYTYINDDVQPKANDDVAEIVEVNIDEIDISSIRAQDIQNGLREIKKLLDNDGIQNTNRRDDN